MKKNLVGLVDADFIKYLVAYDIERMFKNGLTPSAIIPNNTVVALTQKRINDIMDKTSSYAKDYIFLFSGKTKDNFRSHIACVKEYKGNRKYVEKFPKEGEYRHMVEIYIQNNYNYYRVEELEADDLCTMGHIEGTFIYSNDKDLRASPGIHFDIPSEKFVNVTEEEGFKILMAQALSGDSTDNIQGIEGIGKKIAARMIDKCATLEDVTAIVVKTYSDKYGFKNGLDRFVETYTLVNLKTRHGEWVQKKYKDFFNTINTLVNSNQNTLFI